MLAALKHPNIVTIYSVEEADGVHFLCMELVEGQSLDALIPVRGFDVDRLLEIAVPLSAALAAAHAKEVIHRDLKPANVMVSDDGQVKVLDFGLAKLGAGDVAIRPESNAETQFATRSGAVMGTVPYMSPEQLKGASADARTDVYSLGAVLYEMATACRPFDRSSSAELISAILRDSPRPVCELRAELPAELGRTIDRCLEKNPADRFTSRDLHDALARMARQRQAELVAGGSTSRRTAAWATVLGALITIFVVGLVWAARAFLGRSQPEPEPLTLRISPLTSNLGLSLSGSWSPDGSQLAYDFTSNGTMDIAVMSLGGGEPRVIASETGTTSHRRAGLPTARRSPSSPTAGRARTSSGFHPPEARLRASPRPGFGIWIGSLRSVRSGRNPGRAMVDRSFSPDWSRTRARLSTASSWRPARRLASLRPRRESPTSVRHGLPTVSGSRFIERRGARLGSSSFRRAGASRKASSWTAGSIPVRVGRRTAAASSSARSAVQAWTSTIWTSTPAQSAS